MQYSAIADWGREIKDARFAGCDVRARSKMCSERSVTRVGKETSWDKTNLKHVLAKSLSTLCFETVNGMSNQVIPGKLKPPNKITGMLE